MLFSNLLFCSFNKVESSKLETFMLNNVQIDKGFDERLDIFYRINLCIENSEDDSNDAFIDCYYRNIADLKEDLGKLNLD